MLRMSFAMLFLLAACGRPESSNLDGVDKISSMQLKDNGFYDVICLDGTREVIAAKDLNRDNVCPFKAAQPAAGEVFTTADSISKYAGCSTTTVATFGTDADKTIYDGFVSFTVAVNSSATYSSNSINVEVVDGYNAKWSLASTNNLPATTRFHRLKLPAKVAVTSNYCYDSSYGNKVEISSKSVFQTLANEVKYAGDITKDLNIGTLAASLEGANLNVDVSLKLYNNFTAGTDCARIRLVGKNKTVEISNQNPFGVITGLVAPIAVMKAPYCQTSRLPNPEMKDSDFDLTLKALFVATK